MSALVIDAMDDATRWRALAPDGETPSTELKIADDHQHSGYGPDRTSARITAGEAATGHLLRRRLEPLDLAPFSELRLSLRAARFVLQLRLGSEQNPLAAPANTWHRLLPSGSPNRWETVKLGLDDLDPAIAGAVHELELRCLEAPFSAHVDDVIAVRPQLLADVDRALAARLGAIVGTPAQPPALGLTQFDLRCARARRREELEPRDYTADGDSKLMPVGEPYDITYAVTPLATTRAEQTQLLETVIGALAPNDDLIVDGDRLPIELVDVPGPERIGGAPGLDPVLFYRVQARAWTAKAQRVSDVREITVHTDRMEAA